MWMRWFTWADRGRDGTLEHGHSLARVRPGSEGERLVPHTLHAARHKIPGLPTPILGPRPEIWDVSHLQMHTLSGNPMTMTEDTDGRFATFPDAPLGISRHPPQRRGTTILCFVVRRAVLIHIMERP